MSDELWLPVEGSPGYEVSDQGRVRNGKSGRVLRPALQSKGYLKVNLGRKRQVYVHQLVCVAFVGPRPLGHEVDHEDFDRTNNRATNLRWMPKVDNAFRWMKHAEPEPEEPPQPTEDDEWADYLEESGW